jgi:hypothetical protein
MELFTAVHAAVYLTQNGAEEIGAGAARIAVASV